MSTFVPKFPNFFVAPRRIKKKVKLNKKNFWGTTYMPLNYKTNMDVNPEYSL